MTMTTPTPLPLADLAAALVAGSPTHGAPSRVDLPDGRWLTMEVAPDEYANPMDDMGEGSWTGRVEWGTRHPYNGHDVRPDGMDGRARKVYTDGRDSVWWQVPDDVPDDSIDAMGRAIRDLLTYGYSIVVVKLRENVTDSRGTVHTVTVDSACLVRIEPDPDDSYLREVAADLISEVLG